MLTVINRVERARSIVIVKHKYMLMCNHKIRINIMRCLRNSTYVRREIGQLSLQNDGFCNTYDCVITVGAVFVYTVLYFCIKNRFYKKNNGVLYL